MGQMTVGLLYGCELPKFPKSMGDEPVSDLIWRWEKASKIKPTSNGPRIRHEWEGGRDLIGVWVAIGGSGKDDAPCFLENAVLLSDLFGLFSNRVSQAQKLWDRFAAYVAEHERISFPLPRLWLTPAEVA